MYNKAYEILKNKTDKRLVKGFYFDDRNNCYCALGSLNTNVVITKIYKKNRNMFGVGHNNGEIYDLLNLNSIGLNLEEAKVLQYENDFGEFNNDPATTPEIRYNKVLEFLKEKVKQ